MFVDLSHDMTDMLLSYLIYGMVSTVTYSVSKFIKHNMFCSMVIAIVVVMSIIMIFDMSVFMSAFMVCQDTCQALYHERRYVSFYNTCQISTHR